MADTVPILCDYQNLRSQFQWLVDGDLEPLIEDNLEKEVDLLEKYLLSLGKKEVSEIIGNGAKGGEDTGPESRKVLKWISILRAADSLWNHDRKFGLIRLAEEGVSSDPSPQIIATSCHRRVFYLMYSWS